MDPGKSLNCPPGHVACGRGLSMATKTEAMIPVRAAVNTAVVEEEVPIKPVIPWSVKRLHARNRSSASRTSVPPRCRKLLQVPIATTIAR